MTTTEETLLLLGFGLIMFLCLCINDDPTVRKRKKKMDESKDNSLLWEPKNKINQFVFKSLAKAQPPADLDTLEEAVKAYIEIASQSDDGRGNRKKKYSHNFDTDVDTTVLTILVEASALVLSGQLEKLRELERTDNTGN